MDIKFYSWLSLLLLSIIHILTSNCFESNLEKVVVFLVLEKGIEISKVIKQLKNNKQNITVSYQKY